MIACSNTNAKISLENLTANRPLNVKGAVFLMVKNHILQAVVVLLFFGCLLCLTGCGQEDSACSNGLSAFTINPNKRSCKTNCECNNQEYTGVCVEGICKSKDRETCQVEGKEDRCLIEHGSDCREGIRVCKDKGLRSLRWGNCKPIEQQDEKGVKLCGDGIDNDCDGFIDQADEGCICKPGQKEPCYTGPLKTQGIGNCTGGTRTCTKQGVWGACVGQVLPTPEICNTQDDNCDGKTDEGLGDCKTTTCEPGEKQPCYAKTKGCAQKPDGSYSCVGACRSGERECKKDRTWGICVGEIHPKDEESCNNLDDDCDGKTDEGLSRSCYSKALGCSRQNDTNYVCIGTCQAGQQTCSAGKWGLCSGEVPPQAEVCDGKDNDCDGKIDNGVTAPSCSLKQGVCGGKQKRCGGEKGWLPCTSADYGSNFEAKETRCDNLDNDCDGEVDKLISRTCYTGQPGTQGKGICKSGTQVCSKGTWGTCTAEIVPQTDTCNGKDDDCDGKIDNLSAEVCDGKDNDCNGLIDDNLNVFCALAEAHIPSGSYTMGSPPNEVGRAGGEGPQHKVTLTRSFAMMRYEVTQKAFQDVMKYNPSSFKSCGNNCPVENLTWHQAAHFANQLSLRQGLPQCYNCVGSGASVVCTLKNNYKSGSNYYSCTGYRLPTEAEWEYATRAGTTTASYNGAAQSVATTCKASNPKQSAIAVHCGNTNVNYPGCRNLSQYGGNSCVGIHRAGTRKPNVWGLYDTLGNVLEWVYDDNTVYLAKPFVDPVSHPSVEVIVRGGCSWTLYSHTCRAAARYKNSPTQRFYSFGFRLVRTLPPIPCVKPGSTRPCFDGLSTTKNQTPCKSGTQTCLPNQTWGSCQQQIRPKPEVCDGIDNDCDGVTDNNTLRSGNPCELIERKGECKKGTNQCKSGRIVCVPYVAPTTEICNNKDDDCNGLIDDGPMAKPCDSSEVKVPAGSFTMGTPSTETYRKSQEGPQHNVTLTRSIAVRRYESTQREYKQLMGKNPTKFSNCGLNCPIDSVNWHQALAFANAVSKQHNLPQCFDCSTKSGTLSCKVKPAYTGNGGKDYYTCLGYRLPTEAEWEYSARAGTTTSVYSGNVSKSWCRELDPNLDSIGWYCGNSKVKYSGCYDDSKDGGYSCVGPNPIGLKKPNPWGLYDIIGNLREWTLSNGQAYTSSALQDPIFLVTTQAVTRGGSWFTAGSASRSGTRAITLVNDTYSDRGIRLVRTLPPDSCSTLGSTRTCYDGPAGTKGKGTCKAGQQTCQSNKTWSQCLQQRLPTTETCDGKDNDCDGTIDNNVSQVGQTCTVSGQQGPCSRSTYTCKQGNLECPVVTKPSSETCNGKDDDCNGLIDDGQMASTCDTSEVKIKAGSFTMGTPINEAGRYTDEGPQQKVTLSRSFAIRKHEVTQREYKSLTGTNPSYFLNCGLNCPVETVSWHEAVQFTNTLSKAQGLPECFDCSGTGTNLKCKVKSAYSGNNGSDYSKCLGYRLPTEAEWEYSARAGTTTAFYNGGITQTKCTPLDPNLDKIGWYCGNSKVTYQGCVDLTKSGGDKCSGSHPIGLKAPNAWGLYDMVGNIMEWTYDGSQRSYSTTPVTDPLFLPHTHMTYRSSGWEENGRDSRVGVRWYGNSINKRNYLGIRVVRTLP